MLRSPLTRTGIIERIRLGFKAAYLRMLIDACEQDIVHHQYMQERDAALERQARLQLDALRIALMDCELQGRES